MSARTYLALGDSYTIGEGVPLASSWPHQLVDQLIKTGISIREPTIVAQTGWTTSNLIQAIETHALQYTYDVVSLLIGVNNQYQGLKLSRYDEEFEQLLSRALELAGGNSKRVMVLSIPDWGLTPFALDRDTTTVSREINAFNEVNRSITEKKQVTYIDVKTLSDRYMANQEYLVEDGLHPNHELYSLWVELILKENPLFRESSK